MNDKKLLGKVAIISGSTKGLGLGIAEDLAKNGASVVISEEKNLELAQSIAANFEKKYEIPCLGLKIDVSDENMVKTGVEETIKKFGKVDILVNNAGIQIINPIEKFESKDWKLMLSIQLDGAFYMSKYCIESMKKTKSHGRIINIGSVHSYLASACKAPYVAAKHALLGLTRSIAVEGAEFNISANLVAPGFVMTDLVKKQIPERAIAEGKTEEEIIKSLVEKTVDGQLTTIEEVANAVTFFASSPSLAYTGQSLIVSHGFFME